MSVRLSELPSVHMYVSTCIQEMCKTTSNHRQGYLEQISTRPFGTIIIHTDELVQQNTTNKVLIALGDLFTLLEVCENKPFFRAMSCDSRPMMAMHTTNDSSSSLPTTPFPLPLSSLCNHVRNEVPVQTSHGRALSNNLMCCGAPYSVTMYRSHGITNVQ